MKKYLPTIIIFIIVFSLMYFIFGGGITRMQNLMKTDKKTTITTTQLMDKLAEQNFGISPYWLDRYQISISSMEDAQADADNDGLTLEQEYLYLTNPFSDDTDGDGYKDGEEIVNGNSPTGDGKLDDAQIVKDEKSSESLTVKLDDENRNEDDFDNDGLSNDLEKAHGTDPNKADTDGDGYDDLTEIENGYDPVALGTVRPKVEIKIKKIGIDAPVILSNDGSEDALQKDLEGGVVHYPKTAMPGQRGNTYIAGHSSNYSWSAGSYNFIFQNLNNLNVGDKITLTVTQKNGKTFNYEYEVSEKLEVNDDDPRIFANTQLQVLTLTTCWPLGTNDRRLMIKAHLI
ncbi:MAG: class E sortase [Candidatus Moranbacteria bacterium]|nr:class E sortase [Candidatus Moranbacteria bacterium]